MNQKKISGIDSNDLGTIDRLINYFEGRHLQAFPHGLPRPDPDYGVQLENQRLDARLRGAITSLKELREVLLSSEQRG